MKEEDAVLGALAVERGYMTERDLNDCMAALKQGGWDSLAAVIGEAMILNPRQLAEVKKDAEARVNARGPKVGSQEAKERQAAGEVIDPKAVPKDVAGAASDQRNHFGQFIRVIRVGQGGIADVWKSWDALNNRWVALKMLKTETADEENIVRFLKEAEQAAPLDHPGIVKIYEAGWQEEASGGPRKPYIAMEFVDGNTLDEVRSDALTVQQASEMIRAAAEAVSHAHEKGVIHRDLKPRNIMVDKEGNVRVTDFGLAALTATLGPGDEMNLSRTIRVTGTPSYMSPEQALGRTHDIGERSDVYSLGATLYFLVTGQPPFDEGKPVDTCLAVVKKKPTPAPELNKNVNGNLDRLLRRAMAKDPVRRYESAKALATDLGRFLQNASIQTDDQLKFTQGLSALHQGRLEEAIHMFKELLKIAASKDSEISRKMLLKQIDDGIDGLTLAIKQQQKNFDIRTNRGVYHFAKGVLRSLDGSDPSADCKQAMEDFVVAAGLRPEHTPARVNRANVLIFGGRYARDSGKDVNTIFQMALKDLNAAVEFDNTYSCGYHNRGIVRFYIAKTMRKVADQDPEPQYRGAIADFSRAAELEPTYAYVFKDLGVVKVALAKYLLTKKEKVKSLFKEAVDHLDMACRLNEGLYGAFYERGQAHFALKEFEKAVRDFERCQQLDPSRDRKVQALIDEARKHIK